MSWTDAVGRTMQIIDNLGQGAINKERGAHLLVAHFLDDYMRIRFGMQPLDKPREAKSDIQMQAEKALGDYWSQRFRINEDLLKDPQGDPRPAIEIVVNGKPLHIYANGRITAPELAIGMFHNRIPALIKRAQRDALGPDWSPALQECEHCGAHLTSPCNTPALIASCELPDHCFPNGRKPRAGKEESANRKHAADLHDWIERARDEARKSGSTDNLRIAMVQNVDTILAALREYAAGGWVNRPEAAELVNIGREALDERRHLMALDARDKLQGIMSGLPISTPHFHELNELLRKLDEICGSSVVPPDPEQKQLDAFDSASPEERQQIIDNMAIDWDTYRTPVELINHLNDLDGLIDDDAEHEMVEHVLAGRWSIVSHVPPRPTLDPRPDHWKPHALVEEIRKAYAEEENGHSPLAGPVYELIQRLDRGDWVLSRTPDVAKDGQ